LGLITHSLNSKTSDQWHESTDTDTRPADRAHDSGAASKSIPAPHAGGPLCRAFIAKISTIAVESFCQRRPMSVHLGAMRDHSDINSRPISSSIRAPTSFGSNARSCGGALGGREGDDVGVGLKQARRRNRIRAPKLAGSVRWTRSVIRESCENLNSGSRGIAPEYELEPPQIVGHNTRSLHLGLAGIHVRTANM
jgi:hypothetical protein